jgi:hypothetical protein
MEMTTPCDILTTLSMIFNEILDGRIDGNAVANQVSRELPHD